MIFEYKGRKVEKVCSLYFWETKYRTVDEEEKIYNIWLRSYTVPKKRTFIVKGQLEERTEEKEEQKVKDREEMQKALLQEAELKEKRKQAQAAYQKCKGI